MLLSLSIFLSVFIVITSSLLNKNNVIATVTIIYVYYMMFHQSGHFGASSLFFLFLFRYHID